MNEVQCGGVTQIILKLRSTYCYLCLQYAINITHFRKYSVENVPGAKSRISKGIAMSFHCSCPLEVLVNAF